MATPVCVVHVWHPLITCPEASTAEPAPCDALCAAVGLQPQPTGVRAQVYLLFVGVHRAILCTSPRGRARERGHFVMIWFKSVSIEVCLLRRTSNAVPQSFTLYVMHHV